MQFDPGIVLKYLPWLLKGLGVTIYFTVTSLALGLSLGLVFAICRIHPWRPLRVLARVYVDVIRGTPLLVQIFILYYALPAVGIDLSAHVAGILGLGINAGAYIVEIFRAGIEAVPRAHVEAARALGLSYMHTMRRVVLPQAVMLVLPPLTNEFITQVKATSLISTIAIGEMLRAGQLAISITFAPVEIYLAVALLYLSVNQALSQLVQYFERKAEARGGRGEARRTMQDVGV